MIMPGGVMIVLDPVGMRVIESGRRVLLAVQYHHHGERLQRQSRDQHHEGDFSCASKHGWHSRRDSSLRARFALCQTPPQPPREGGYEMVGLRSRRGGHDIPAEHRC